MDPTLVNTIGMKRVGCGFPVTSSALEVFGLKFSAGGAHISRTMMLAELGAVLIAVPRGSSAEDYRNAILQRNVLGKSTDSTRQKSLRHLRELYALDEAVPVFGLLRKLYSSAPASLALLALQVAWARDPLLRSTTSPVLDASEGQKVETAALAQSVGATFPDRYSDLNCNKVARNAAASWTQAGHLVGRAKKIRRRVTPSSASISMALFLGDCAEYHGASAFSNPWCRLLDLNAAQARAGAIEAHRAGLINLRAVGEVVELSFPSWAEFQICLR